MGAGLYVHVPYCRHRCPYCDFNVWVDRSAPWTGLTAAMVRDIEARAPELATPFRSVYFGGGTPSLAPASLFSACLDAARGQAGLLDSAEITMEIEPDTIDRTRLRELVALGINRASLGWQSTHDRLLKVLGRGHRAEAGRRMVDDARAAGFHSVSIDLIFAVPGQTMAELEADLNAVLEFEPEHISLYALTFEPDTEFEKRRIAGRITPADNDLEAAMMVRIEERLVRAGYSHYEVSSYAKDGHEAVHNSGYWSGEPYLGVGPGAHSYLPDPPGARRMMTRRRPGAYIESSDFEWQELLTPRQVITERLMTAVRLERGIDVATLPVLPSDVLAAANLAESRGWLSREGSRWRPTREGRHQADALAALFA